ncbi:MAG: FixH family protein [Chryseolinea sp.]
MNWGKSIVVAFVAFAAFIGVLVTICVREDISLVSNDYYQEELDYGAQMQRVRNAQLLQRQPSITLTADHQLKLQCPSDFQLDHGQIHLYSPRNIKQDRMLSLSNETEGEKYFAMNGLERGKYKVKMTWSMHGKEFYYETVIYL